MYRGQAACNSLPRHSVMNCGVHPVAGVALPLSCSAARYSWRMKGPAWVCSASRAFQSAAFTSSGEARTRMT